ncbi:PD-(D/E)XK nuclease family protein [Marixanthomonas spongiae]|uniref:PD-(D/E)XK nuclease family protein n=1 Tax=Marixanthomonas spongiae TaxID=2174845 RepID=A0A2U0I285_9FLAO|nr:PD-(D/E)XK nuclease family protein [Marixanthomonas spongiae]PVW15231.1 PD-(D/E)XK nuclease family protein [Marixanthomonas spongiae]
MQTFLEETLLSLKKNHDDIAELTLVLPSKRAGGFLKNYLGKHAQTASFLPKIISIETFIEQVSGLSIIDSTELLFKSYQVYLNTASFSEKGNFENYSTWAPTLLNDFNEIDRYLVDPKAFFTYLGSIKTLERWNLQEEKTELIEKYLQFWNSLLDLYNNIKQILLKEAIGYQGLVYRVASEKIKTYSKERKNEKYAFIGFNALNAAEQHIIQHLLQTGNTEVYWDADETFMNDPKHSASLFIRRYLKKWGYYKNESANKEKNRPQGITDHFKAKKDIHFVEVQKNIGQAKYVGELLAGYSKEKLHKTAVVLADENLLIPMLHSLPPNVDSVNVTMGAVLKNVPATLFFELLLSLHSVVSGASKEQSKWMYYKDILSLINHPLGTVLLSSASDISHKISTENKTHLSSKDISQFSDKEDAKMVALLFQDWGNKSETAVTNCLKILNELKKQFQENPVQRVVLYQLYQIFSKIEALNHDYPHLDSVKTVQSLFAELVATTSLDFEGDAYEGLQIMGVLETRVLDFENIIVTSVNEGVLPTGKSNASFITYDLKKEFNLPLYTEKDAIYTYHFYHMLQRAKEVTLLYNNHSEGINTGEKSRFLLQLEIEKQANHTISKTVLSPKITPTVQTMKTIEKTDAVMQRLQEIAGKGFSPSALTSYIRNPIDFYFQKILRLQETEEVEETVAANTLGTIVHDTLEIFYKPHEGKLLTSEILNNLKPKIEEEVTKQFKDTFKGGTFDKGKNLIIFEVAKRYIENFINHEISEIKAGNEIKIISIENNLDVDLPISELPFPVKIRGKVDRVDQYNGQLRIIDYKTGKVAQNNVELVDWEEISLDYKYSKSFQVLAYALMFNHEKPFENTEAGIISFKNLNNGFLKFGKKEKVRGGAKDQIITQATLDAFAVELKKLILEICTKEIPFTEKEIE